MFGNNSKENYKIIKHVSDGKKITNIPVTLLLPIMSQIFMGILIFIVSVIAGIIIAIITKEIFAPTSIPAYITLFSTIITILFYFLWVKFYEKRPFKSIGFWKESFIQKYLKGFLVGALSMTLITIILVLAGGKISLNVVSFNSFIIPFLLTFLGWLIQGASEEITLRGHMFPVLTKKINFPVGIIVSSVYFGALHFLNPDSSPLALINISLFGAFACFYTLWDESLWGICAYHSAWNFFQGTIFGHRVSGAQNDISLFNFTLNGDNLFNGGIFGPEAGIVSTIILILSIVLIIFLLKKKNNFLNDFL